jgi:hypothetical protein
LGLQQETEYVQSTSIGSFSREALAPIQSFMQWSDAVWLVDDIGKNSETSLLLEELVAKTSQRLIVSGDALDCFIQQPSSLLKRDSTLLLCNFAQLQKMLTKFGEPAITSTMGIIQLVEHLETFSAKIACQLTLAYEDKYLIAYNGDVISSPSLVDDAYSVMAVWWTQFPTKPLEALATALVDQS